MRYSARKLDKALWYTGSGQRMRRFLAKAGQGNGFTVSVVGGSGQSSPSRLSTLLGVLASKGINIYGVTKHL